MGNEALFRRKPSICWSIVLLLLLPFISSGEKAMSATETDRDNLAVATFAGGCFWCMEPPFDKLEGVVATTSGYTGGHVENPSYEQVSSGGTGHAEAVRISYDPDTIGYEELLGVFWHNIDPVTANAQFCDRGSQYRSAIFYHSKRQKELALKSRQRLEKSGTLPGPVVTEIEPAGEFYPAEEYHQDYYKKKPIRYKFYRFSCGRDKRLEELWGDKGGGETQF